MDDIKLTYVQAWCLIRLYIIYKGIPAPIEYIGVASAYMQDLMDMGLAVSLDNGITATITVGGMNYLQKHYPDWIIQD